MPRLGNTIERAPTILSSPPPLSLSISFPPHVSVCRILPLKAEMVPRTRRNTVRSPSLRFMSSGQLQAFSHEKKRTVREFSALSFSFPFLFPFLFLFSFGEELPKSFETPLTEYWRSKRVNFAFSFREISTEMNKSVD